MSRDRNLAVRLLISARDEASSVFTSLQAKVAAVATAIAGYFGVRFFAEAISSAADFEAAMSRVQAASGASGDELAALKTAAEEAGATTKYTSTEAANALENLAKSGLSASQAVEALPAVLTLAQAGGVELGTAAEYVTKAVAGMGLSFAEAGRVADVLALGANASNTSVEGLAQALSYAAPLAQSLGLSLEQTVGIIGKFADAGIDASRAGTALNAILAQFSDPASKFRQELASAGIITGNFNDALRQLAAKGPAGQKAINAVGQEAGPALRALLNQGIGALDDLTGKLKNAAGSAAETAGVMGNNLQGAMSGLSSAWDAVRRTLVAPLLGPLATQVTALAERFRAAVADGTIGRFGEAIRIAFESGAKWVTAFVGQIDFQAAIVRMRAFGAESGEIFKSVGDKATAAAASVQTAYGVMAAGVNTVMMPIYLIAEAFAGVASNILFAASKINEGLAKITFGSVSAKFAEMATELRIQSGGLWAVSEAFAEKARLAFLGMAGGAETANAGWKALNTSAAEAAPAVTAAAAALETAAAQAAAAAPALAESAAKADEAAVAYTALGVSAQDAAKQYAAITASTGVTVTSMRDLEEAVLEGRLQFDEASKTWKAGAGELVPLAERMRATDAAANNFAQSVGAAGTATSGSTRSVAALREEYARLIAAGDLQAATEKMQEIEAAMNGLGSAAQHSAEDVAAAFERLGVTSQATLEQLRAGARRDFEIIKNSGTAAPRDIQAAFTAYAERAVAANNGVVSSALQVEAATNGLRVSADEAGKVIVQTMTEAAFATQQVGTQAQQSAEDMRDMGRAAQEATDMIKAAQAANANVSAAGHSSFDDWNEQELKMASSGEFGEAVKQGYREWRRRKDEERKRREEDERERRAREEEERAQREEEDAARRERIARSGGGLTGGRSRDAREREESERERHARSAAGNGTIPGPAADTQGPGLPPSRRNSGVQVLGVYRFEIGIRGGSNAAIHVASPTDAKILENVLRQLEAAAGVAS